MLTSHLRSLLRKPGGTSRPPAGKDTLSLPALSPSPSPASGVALALSSHDDALSSGQPHPMTDTQGSPPLTHHFRAPLGGRGGVLRGGIAGRLPLLSNPPALPFLGCGWQTPLNYLPASASLPRGPGLQVAQLVGDELTLGPENQAAAVAVTHQAAAPPAVSAPGPPLLPCC